MTGAVLVVASYIVVSISQVPAVEAQGAPDVSITKQAMDAGYINEVGTYTAGTTANFQLDVQNHGPGTATGLVVTDTLPIGWKATHFASPGWRCSADTQQTNVVTCTKPSLTVSTSTIQITASIPSGETNNQTNVAHVKADQVANPNDDTATVELSPLPVADLFIAKENDVIPVAGGPLTYEFTVTNLGPSDVPRFRVTDQLVAELTFESYSSDTPGVSCSVRGQDVTCDGANLVSGDTATFDVTVTVDPAFPGSTLSNTADVSQPDGIHDPDTSNNSSTDPTDVDHTADLSVTKTGPATAVAGDSVTYTIRVHNAGPSTDQPGRDVKVTDHVPAGVTYGSATGTDWECALDAGTVSCIYTPTLAPNTTAPDITLILNVNPQFVGQVHNVAQVTGSYDPNMDNNTAEADTAVNAEANLGIEKTHSGDFAVGSTHDFSFTVTNSGPSYTPSFTVSDTLVPELRFVSASDPGCGHLGQIVTCDGGALSASAPGNTATFTVTVAVVDTATPGTITNTATVTTPPGTEDPNPDNSDTDTVNITASADLAIKKTDSGGAKPGGQVDFRLAVTNHGPNSVSSYSVTDDLDSRLSYVTYSGDATCTPSAQQISCTGSALAKDATAHITITVTIDANVPNGTEIDNTAQVSPPTGVTDPDSSDNSSTDPLEVASDADLSVSKTHSGSFIAGEEGEYKLTVTNHGPADVPAGDVKVVDQLPDGISYLPDDTTGWTCIPSDQTVTCRLAGPLANGASSTLKLRVRIAATMLGRVTNEATVSSPLPDPDPDDSTTKHTTTVEARADLRITKQATGSLTAGREGAYRITVTNHGGPSAARGVTIHDRLPPYLHYRHFEGDGWGCEADGRDVTCKWKRVLGVDQSASVELTVLVDQDAPSEAVNEATVTFDGTDPSPGKANPKDPVRHEADLEAILRHEQKQYFSGDLVVYTYTIINHGPSAAQDVTVTHTQPDGVRFRGGAAGTAGGIGGDAGGVELVLVSRSSAAQEWPLQCAIDGSQRMVCRAGTLLVGSYRLRVEAKLDEHFTGSLTSTLEVSSTTDDPNLANNRSTDVLSVVPAVDRPLPVTGPRVALVLATTGGALLLAGLLITWFALRRSRVRIVAEPE